MSNQDDWQLPPAHAMGGYTERTLHKPWPFPLSVSPEGGIVRNVLRPPSPDMAAAPTVRGEVARKRAMGELPEVVRRRAAKGKPRRDQPETTIELGWVSPDRQLKDS